MKFNKKSIAIGSVILAFQLISCAQKQKEVSYFDAQANSNYLELKDGFLDGVPSDQYLRHTGQGAKMLRKEVPISFDDKKRIIITDNIKY